MKKILELTSGYTNLEKIYTDNLPSLNEACVCLVSYLDKSFETLQIRLVFKKVPNIMLNIWKEKECNRFGLYMNCNKIKTIEMDIKDEGVLNYSYNFEQSDEGEIILEMKASCGSFIKLKCEKIYFDRIFAFYSEYNCLPAAFIKEDKEIYL